MFVHFDRKTEDIIKIGPIAKETETVGVVQIPAEIGRKIVTGEEKIQNYLVFKSGDTYMFDRSQDVVDMFTETLKHFSLEELKPIEGETECTIILDRTKNQLTVKLNTFLNKPLHQFRTMLLPTYKIPLYVSKKNDPTYLLAVVNPVVSDIVQKYSGVCTYDIRVLPKEVSIYTKPIFKTYSLEIING